MLFLKFVMCFFFFQQKSAYELLISDWSSDVCSSDLIETALANFMASGVLRLGAKLGPVLWQFPPNMRFAAERFRAFLKLLPKDGDAAASFARRHDSRLKGRAWTTVDDVGAIRHAVRSEEHTSELQSLMRISYA